ncbi:MAG: ATP-binding protein [Deltaproteobacteria bacterium]|nr:ATP-binding protein [Deltaproteobacteria bacterium]
MYSRILNYTEKKSFFLFGPRGTGKSTWVRTRFPHALYLDLLRGDLYTSLLADPHHLARLIPPDWQDWIIIDEVQKVPALLDEVHRLIEEKKLCFVLTGSSARKLKRAGSNLLAGRALNYTMHPFTSVELGDDFKLAKALEHGLLPATWSETDPQQFLAAYVQTYLQEEILAEGLTRRLDQFSRFLQAASFSQGSLLNITQVARDCAVERKTVSNYFEILEDLLLAIRLPIFQRRARRRLVQHPKFYYFDVGVYRVLRPQGPLDDQATIEGIAYESLWLQEMRALDAAYHWGYEFFYWRTQTGYEVDFVLYGKKGFFAFEIKRSSRLRPADFKGLKAFKKEYPEAKLYLIYGGSECLYEEGITCLPYQQGLNQLGEILA